MNLRQLFVLVSVVIGWSIETSRADLVFSSGSRSVFSAATYGTLDFSATTVAGLYTDSASTIGVGPGGAHSASASQSSLTPDTTGPLMSGTGHSESSISATGMDGYSTTGESVFIVSFQVDVDGMYDLDTSVSWTGDVPPFGGSNHAWVELKNNTTSTQLAYTFKNFASQGTLSSSYMLALEAGDTYELVALARVSGSGGLAGVASADADWSFDLTSAAIPEAGSVAMMTLASLGAAFGACWRRQRQCPQW